MQTEQVSNPSSSLDNDSEPGILVRIEELLTEACARFVPLNMLWKVCSSKVCRRVAISPLELGLKRPLLVRRERVRSSRSGNVVRLLYLSDLHLHPLWGLALVQQITSMVVGLPLDAIILGGDLVECPSQLPLFESLVEFLSKRAQVVAVPGNHDRRVGLSALESAVHASGGIWLAERDLSLHNDVRLYGSIPSGLVSGEFSILCAHDPNVFPKATVAGFKLVLAGHIHGGQVHLWRFGQRSYPGAFAYSWNGTRFESPSSEMIVSRGLVDMIPLRWRCPREAIYVEV